MRRQLTPIKVVIAGLIFVVVILLGMLFVSSGLITGHYPQAKPISGTPALLSGRQADNAVSTNVHPAAPVSGHQVAGSTTVNPSAAQPRPTPKDSNHHDSLEAVNGQTEVDSSSFNNWLQKTKDSLQRFL